MFSRGGLDAFDKGINIGMAKKTFTKKIWAEKKSDRGWGRESHWNSEYMEYIHLSAMALYCILICCATVGSILKVFTRRYHMTILPRALYEWALGALFLISHTHTLHSAYAYNDWYFNCLCNSDYIHFEMADNTRTMQTHNGYRTWGRNFRTHSMCATMCITVYTLYTVQCTKIYRLL